MVRPLAFLPYLKAFEAVSRLGTLRGAADELHLSPSAISLQLRKLGDVTGIVLFERDGRNVALTEAGRDFSRTVSQTLAQLSAAVRDSGRHDVHGATRSLSVSLPTALGVAWLSSAVVEFAESRGISNLTINEAIVADAVDWERSDIAIVYDNPPFPGRSWQLLSEVQLKTVCSPVLFPRLDLQHRERRLNGITLLHEDDGQEWNKWAIAARVDLQGSARVRVPSVAHAVSSAVQGRGIALLSNVLTGSYLNEGRLIQPFSTAINAARAYYFVSAADRADDPLLKAFVARMIEFLETMKN
ncbi:MAG TPA: LysR family transcriptional regulator [Mesorhizobium sp.]|jgi:LysR family glycine cleavage system transcriptional activator|uniref:LysR family transcriptional regulator n=1 Tax=Mesorhizobium sp. TaxID=1871066 RepID=UPI002DDD70D2|nr:LysR family transcriptional regulator [Mesorhizobium sp.]HEV2503531.1 LysR family transcriptional regulator [Mesorhizobium sp.]